MARQKVSVFGSGSSVSSWAGDSSDATNQIELDYNMYYDSILFAAYPDVYNITNHIVDSLAYKSNTIYNADYIESFIDNCHELFSDSDWFYISTSHISDALLLRYNELINSEVVYISNQFTKDTLLYILENSKLKNDLAIDAVIKTQLELPLIYLNVFSQHSDACSESRVLTYTYLQRHYNQFNHDTVRNLHPEWYQIS